MSDRFGLSSPAVAVLRPRSQAFLKLHFCCHHSLDFSPNVFEAASWHLQVMESFLAGLQVHSFGEPEHKKVCDHGHYIDRKSML